MPAIKHGNGTFPTNGSFNGTIIYNQGFSIPTEKFMNNIIQGGDPQLLFKVG